MDNTLQLDAVEGKKPSVFKRIFMVLLVTAMLLAGTVYMAGFVLIKGPSAYAGHEFIRAVQDDEVLSLLPKLYLTEWEIQEIIAAGETPVQFSLYPAAK
ncbi:MAG: hypothetical protein IJD81_08130 [Oscillospiraceae bacterium]|nr:hypothetical protein [Oscillospiraceae bacterium]